MGLNSQKFHRMVSKLSNVICRMKNRKKSFEIIAKQIFCLHYFWKLMHHECHYLGLIYNISISYLILRTHCAKVQKYSKAKQVSNFLICGANKDTRAGFFFQQCSTTLLALHIKQDSNELRPRPLANAPKTFNSKIF